MRLYNFLCFVIFSVTYNVGFLNNNIKTSLRGLTVQKWLQQRDWLMGWSGTPVRKDNLSLPVTRGSVSQQIFSHPLHTITHFSILRLHLSSASLRAEAAASRALWLFTFPHGRFLENKWPIPASSCWASSFLWLASWVWSWAPSCRSGRCPPTSGTTSSRPWPCTRGCGCPAPSRAPDSCSARSTTPSCSWTVSPSQKFL